MNSNAVACEHALALAMIVEQNRDFGTSSLQYQTYKSATQRTPK
jgi:hypothetical protein